MPITAVEWDVVILDGVYSPPQAYSKHMLGLSSQIRTVILPDNLVLIKDIPGHIALFAKLDMIWKRVVGIPTVSDVNDHCGKPIEFLLCVPLGPYTSVWESFTPNFLNLHPGIGIARYGSLTTHEQCSIINQFAGKHNQSLVVDQPKLNLGCQHEFINVGFTTLKLVCKHCDMEKL